MKIRLETLYQQGMPDPDTDYSFEITRESYRKLPILKKDFSDYNYSAAQFREIYRGHVMCDDAYHKAVMLYSEDEKIGSDEYYNNNQKYWYFLWLRDENVWIAFEYADYDCIAESYTSTVETADPRHGKIYRLNADAMKIVNEVYGK